MDAMRYGRVSLLAMMLGAAAGAVRGDDYSQWAKGADLWLNTSFTGANVAGTVTGFPLLVRLAKHNFAFAEAQGAGQDIRFAKPDGTHLPYQIERWDSAAGLAEIWVRLDTVKGATADQSIRLLWGNPAAFDSSNGASVFDSADGHVAVWHMDRMPGNERRNSVPGGHHAVPVNYDGDESVPGLIGTCDRLDGGDPGDHLNLGAGYADFSTGFTYSVWAKPTQAMFWSRLLDMGNGEGIDNLVVQRRLTSDNLEFASYVGTAKGKSLTVDGAFPVGEWQHFAFTVDGRQARMYRNGVLIGSETFDVPVAVVQRNFNWIGKSNWPGNRYFKGDIDEPRLARRAHGADWVKLSWANQREDQSLVSFDRAGFCSPAFGVPADTAVGEGTLFTLRGVAECATDFAWSVVSGPVGPILDPGVKALPAFLPRVAADTAVRYRFSARMGDSTHSAVVTVRIKEEIPDPAYTLPSRDWNGRDTLEVEASISNWGAIKASRAPDFTYEWTLSGVEADTVWKHDRILLSNAKGQGGLTVGLCLDNGGAKVCQTAMIQVRTPTRLGGMPVPAGVLADPPRYDAAGRRLPQAPGGPRLKKLSGPAPREPKQPK